MHNTVIKLLMFVLCLLPTTLQAANTYNNLYVFGDSLSDNGNFIALSGQPNGFTLPPPFFGNRISNGFLAVENLAQIMGLALEPYYVNPLTGNNFSVGSASARGTSAIDLTGQVTAFLTSKSNAAPSDALYIVFIGANDMRAIRDALIDRAPRQERLDIFWGAQEAIETNVRRLIDHGARNLLVVYAPAISRAPETIALAENNPRILRQIERRTRLFNRNLKRTLDYLRFEYNDVNNIGIKLAEFNLPAYSKSITSNNLAYDFSVIREGCLTIDHSNLQITGISPSCGASLELLNNFLYFDQLHLASGANELLGRALYSFMPSP